MYAWIYLAVVVIGVMFTPEKVFAWLGQTPTVIGAILLMLWFVVMVYIDTKRRARGKHAKKRGSY